MFLLFIYSVVKAIASCCRVKKNKNVGVKLHIVDIGVLMIVIKNRQLFTTPVYMQLHNIFKKKPELIRLLNP